MTPRSHTPGDLSDSIRATLAYSDYFQFPLTEDELHARLINVKVSRRSLRDALTKMKGSVQKTGMYFHLAGKESLVGIREQRKELSTPLMSRARRWASILGHFPGVQAVYVTGSLAVENTDGQDDIDYMVVADNGRLWTARLLLTFATTILFLRRTPNARNSAGKICLNLYLTPDFFQLPGSKRNVYTAYELIQAVPVYDPLDTRSMLLSANSWLREILPNVEWEHTRPVRFSRRSPSGFSRWIESWAYRLQRRYMAPRLTREYVTPGVAFFHPADPGEKVIKRIGG